jgi:aspartyl-tRNA(Asn)/glutamyl-tRNA(Gln) amidotransferase subunit A
VAEDLAYQSLHAIGDLLRKREISAQELVDFHLARADSLQPRLNAFITMMHEEARRTADELDRKAARGESRGPLHGIPLTLKDLISTKGVRTTSGSKVFADFVPEEDAVVTKRLREAGAVFLGKTNLHELAYGISNVNPHYGAVRNPWDDERISGGSSGGSAASLAAGIGYGSVGTDTGGSIRIPSALCGTVGLKPTYGLVSREGVTPLAWSLDHVGPMARTVEDVAILLDVLAEPTAGAEIGSASEGLEDLPKGLRMGIHADYFGENLDPEVREAVGGAVRDLEKLGLERLDVSIPEVRYQGTCRDVVLYVEAAAYYEASLRKTPEGFSESARELLQLGSLIRGTEYLTAQRARRRVLQAFREAFDRFDVLVTPTVPVTAPRIGEETLSNGEELRPALLRLVTPFNTVGFPALSLPCGYTEAGLPVGLQLAARPYKEALLLKVAHAYEQSHGWLVQRPLLGGALE